MFKGIFFSLCIAFLSLSFIKPGYLKKIASCKIEIDSKAVYPGNTLELIIETKLKDSTVIRSSASNFTINFADYDFTITGGATILEKSRTKLSIEISNDAYREPFVHFSAVLRRKPSIKWEQKFPIRYDVVQKVAFAGKNGYDPRATTANGYRKIPLVKGVNLEFIDEEQTLTNNSDPNLIGGSGPNLDVYVSLIGNNAQEQFIKVEVRSDQGTQIYKYLKLGVGSLEVQTIGGKGGISKTGGKGGRGGDVTVFITPEAKPYFNQIFIVNYGGEGGQLWRPKIDGEQQGPYGDDGDVKIVKWDGE